MPGTSSRSSILVCVVVLATTRVASSQTASTGDETIDQHKQRPVRAELLLGAGHGNVHITTGESRNAYGAAIGLRALYRFGFGGFLGLRYDHFLGTTSEYSWSGVARLAYTTGANFLGAELGYELLLPHAFVRPLVALGPGFQRRSVECAKAEGSYSGMADQLCTEADRAETANRSWHFAIAPGLTMGLRTGRFEVLVEPRYYFWKDANAFALLGGIGWLF